MQTRTPLNQPQPTEEKRTWPRVKLLPGLFLVIAGLAVLLISYPSLGQNDTDKGQPLPPAPRGFNFDHILMEYAGDVYFAYQIDALQFFDPPSHPASLGDAFKTGKVCGDRQSGADEATNTCGQINVGVRTSSPLYQLCAGSKPTCGNGGDTSNHFDGANTDRWDNDYHFGGTLNNGSKFWVKLHPGAPANPTGNPRIKWIARGRYLNGIWITFGDDIPGATNNAGKNGERSDRVQLHLSSHSEIGFKGKRPLVDAQKGETDKLYITWDDAIRYKPDESSGTIRAHDDGRPRADRLAVNQRWGWGGERITGDIDWTYGILHTDDSSRDHTLVGTPCNSNPEQCWSHKNLQWWEYARRDDTNRKYSYVLTNKIGDYQPETEIFVRVRVAQFRHGERYNIYSGATRFFTPGTLALAEQNDNGLKIAWKNTYTGVDRYSYRLGYTEARQQTSWTTNGWIEACNEDIETETINNEEHQTLTITSPNGINNGCGPDLTTPLETGQNYQIQLRAEDDSRTYNPYVRNYVHSDPVNLPAPPPTTTPDSTTPTTQPSSPTTQPTTPPNTSPPATTPPANIPPATSPPAPPGGGNQVIVIGDNNNVIIGDDNTINFIDTVGNTHEANIDQLAASGVTRGCNPPTNNRFCPDRAVTRAEMATFMVRAFDLALTDHDPFTDTSSNVHATNINRMANAGISRGCNPPTNDRFCPDRAVTRAEMATFMTRVLELEAEGSGFDDTSGNVHATNINRFANAGITRGCNPPQNTRYCPDRAVTRAEMATFMTRATDLTPS